MSSYTIQIILLSVFLIYLLICSVISVNRTESINSFAIGNRTFSTITLTATIIATWISGSGLVMDITEFRKQGIVYFVESIGMCANLAIFAYFFVPKMSSVLGQTSISSYMKGRYGPVVGNLVCVLGVITSMGGISIQFKIMGDVLCYFFELDHETYGTYAIIFSSLIIILYTFSGGIRSVVRTDVIQCICFFSALFIAIGTFDIMALQNAADTNITVTTDSKFTLDHFNTLSFSEWMQFIFVLGYFAVPGFKPHVIQRVSMAKNIEQAKKSYYYGALGLLVVLTLSCYLSYLINLANPALAADQMIKELVDSFHNPLFKTILIVGIISMCMSTADSNLNVSSVLLANDFFLFEKQSILKKIYTARFFTIAIGLLSIAFAVTKMTLLEIVLFSSSFYIPTVSIPFAATILGYKITTRTCLIAIITSLTFVCSAKLLKVGFDVNLIGMILNAFLLTAAHHIIEKWNLLAFIGIKSQLKNEK